MEEIMSFMGLLFLVTLALQSETRVTIDYVSLSIMTAEVLDIVDKPPCLLLTLHPQQFIHETTLVKKSIISREPVSLLLGTVKGHYIHPSNLKRMRHTPIQT